MWILLLVQLLTLLAPLDVLKLKEIAIALFISKKKSNCIEEAMYYELFTPGKSLESNWHQHHPLYHANLVLHFYCLSHLVDSLFFAK